MTLSKLLLIVALAGFTGINVLLQNTQVVHACECLRSDGTPKCRGDCCGGPGDACDCYDVGTDNCYPAPKNLLD
jgi:hypothetical protein